MKFYRIYQLPHNNDNLFKDYDRLDKFDLGDYCCVWADDIEVEFNGEVDRLRYCEDLFRIFNIEHPRGFGGHSMSVSDVVMLVEDDKRTLYYCDGCGFKKIEK